MVGLMAYYMRQNDKIQMSEGEQLFDIECGFLRMSQNLEELIDEFVGILPNEMPYSKNYRLRTFNKIKATYLRLLSVEPKAECYGAIWTDKGLIYVAKMNEKGELELI